MNNTVEIKKDDRNLTVFNEDISSVYSVPQGPDIKKGLRNSDGSGVLVGTTAIGSVQGYIMEDGQRVPVEGKLYYRGINALDIISAHRNANTFGYEEVAYLLLFGKLPSKNEFEYFKEVIASARSMPLGFNDDVLLRAPSENIMNQLSRGVEALYAYDPCADDTSPENLIRQSVELVARFPLIVANAYAVKRHRFQNKSLYLHNPKPELSLSENFLRMVRPDKSYTDAEAKLLDIMLMLHAEHGGGNNSAFVCRAVSSSGTDTYSAVAAAVNSLKGPLHGGANAKVMEMIGLIKQELPDYTDEEKLRKHLIKMLDGKAGDRSGKIYGLGHAVYTLSDPRAGAIRECAKDLAATYGRTDELKLLENIEKIGCPLIVERKNLPLPVCANVDLYSGFVYDMLGIPHDLYTPLFAIARVAGWCAHRMEEVISCKRIMRPAYRAAIKKVPYTPTSER